MKKLLVILLGVGLLFLFTQCSTSPDEKISRSLESELALLPDTPTSLAHVNMGDIRNSFVFASVREEIESSMEHDRKFQRFLKKSGLNPLTDFEEVLFSSYDRKCCGRKHILAVVTGKFSPEKLEEYILSRDEDEEIVSSEYEGYRIFSGKNENFGLTFLSGEKLIAGNSDLLREYIDRTKSGEISADHQKMLRDIKYKSGSWVAVDAQKMLEMGEEMLSRMPSRKPAEVLKTLSEMNFSVRFDKDIRIHVHGKFESSEKAEYLKDTAKGMIAAAKLAVSENRDLIDILNKCKIENAGKTIELNFKLSQKDYKMLQEARKDFPRVAALHF